ncbi:cysteinyl leukotriene receptor 2-like isoform X2 [Pristis pectinata]|nr:cysteinyl leukotriene receptor 2-like isoform X2 [Pristis pectinata]XP_051870854.1 cysteinyl leukotriene receptor 2-like isoform X2 [Pristis pectinata]XP_051870855.1 cysteinyl leukotriene receptor 2-like isoform X2 [Pristis pectinata]XP_051870856.1 cysteinyl leukotriene receptor 2-like isoform X2 [Pristis pectinata]XP_051870857.1 cysteinyl leukotriene receptor 2-like isoform X2 [Pristis pectinata]XP_051870858.1 cysteinyl leukotriene receptor 2-like isoform X2 [Pristis pectinata]XP_05187085
MNNTTAFGNDFCKDISNFKTHSYLPVYMITFIFGFIENVFCLYVFLKLYKRKSEFSIVMVNLAIADLLFVCTLPWRVYYYWRGGIWDFSQSFCTFMFYALYLNMYCSIYFLTLMSILRYFAVVHPLKYLRYRTIKNVLILCIFIWVFVGIAASPLLQYTAEDNKTVCLDPDDKISSKIYSMNLISVIVGCIIPFFIISICYIFVLKTLLISKAKNNKQKYSRKKAIVMIIIVMVIFLVTFLPYHILRTVHLAMQFQDTKSTTQVNCFVQHTVVVTLCGVAINTCLDPLLYYFGAESFRDKLRTKRNTLNSQI